MSNQGPIYEIFESLNCQTIGDIGKLSEEKLTAKIEELQPLSNLTDLQWQIRKSRANNIVTRVKEGIPLEDLPCSLELQCFVCGNWPVKVTEVINPKQNHENSKKFCCYTCVEQHVVEKNSDIWPLGPNSENCIILENVIAETVNRLKIFRQKVVQ